MLSGVWTSMLHQENSEAFVRHHSEQLACGNMRGADNGRPNFLPEKCQIAGSDLAASSLLP